MGDLETFGLAAEHEACALGSAKTLSFAAPPGTRQRLEALRARYSRCGRLASLGHVIRRVIEVGLDAAEWEGAEIASCPIASPDSDTEPPRGPSPQTPEEAPSSLDLVLQTEARDLTEACMAMLSPRERLVIRARLGLDGERKTLARLGADLGVSGETIRVIETTTHEKLRAHARRMQQATSDEAALLTLEARHVLVWPLEVEALYFAGEHALFRHPPLDTRKIERLCGLSSGGGRLLRRACRKIERARFLGQAEIYVTPGDLAELPQDQHLAIRSRYDADRAPRTSEEGPAALPDLGSPRCVAILHSALATLIARQDERAVPRLGDLPTGALRRCIEEAVRMFTERETRPNTMRGARSAWTHGHPSAQTLHDAIGA